MWSLPVKDGNKENVDSGKKDEEDKGVCGGGVGGGVEIGGRLMVQGQIKSWGGQPDCWFPLRKRNWQPVQRRSKHLHLKACGAIVARDESATFTGFFGFFFFFLSCIKDKYQLQKLWSPPERISRGWFLWVYPIGLWIDHRRRRGKKQHFKGLGDPPGFPLKKKKKKT